MAENPHGPSTTTHLRVSNHNPLVKSRLPHTYLVYMCRMDKESMATPLPISFSGTCPCGRWRPDAEKVRPAHGGIYATKVARSGSLGDLDLTVISTVHERQAMKRCQSRQEHSTPTVPPLIQKLPLLESVGRAQRAITGVGRICSYGDPLPKIF